MSRSSIIAFTVAERRWSGDRAGAQRISADDRSRVFGKGRTGAAPHESRSERL